MPRRTLLRPAVIGALLLATFATSEAAQAAKHPRIDWFPRGQCTRWAYVKRPDVVDKTVRRTHASNWAAKFWASNAAGAGFRVDGSPRRGDLAVWGGGGSGHIAYVEWVGRSRIRVSEMNFNGNPHVSKRRIGRSGLGGVQFIHRR